ncbi:hypothetical protein PG994_009665 [Apiospora phragmitis]|uniref:Uncharacterized protein n=1 Tax=Apiospora phragmitis TaxID=2905665 RepID=A0ABR1U6S1_9PEZI
MGCMHSKTKRDQKAWARSQDKKRKDPQTRTESREHAALTMEEYRRLDRPRTAAVNIRYEEDGSSSTRAAAALASLGTFKPGLRRHRGPTGDLQVGDRPPATDATSVHIALRKILGLTCLRRPGEKVFLSFRGWGLNITHSSVYLPTASSTHRSWLGVYYMMD